MLDRSGRRSRPSFVGRTLELGRLERLFERVDRGGGVALVRGEPGVGKTSVATAIVERVADRATVLWGACLEEGAAPAFGPWRLALESTSARRAVDDALGVLGRASAVLAPLVPVLRDRADLALPVPLDAPEQRLRLFEAVAALLRALAATRPLVVVLDDLQWIDVDSRDLLQYLLGLLPRERWLFVATARATAAPELAGLFAALARTPEYEHVELAGLDRDDAAAMIAALVERDIPADVVAAIHLETNGLPFYVRELVRSIGDDGRVGALPRSIHDALSARLLRLDATARELLGVLAVLSRPADAALLAGITRATLAAVLDHLEEAARAGFVRVLEDGRYELAHAIFRRALLEPLLPERVALLRRRVAEALVAIGGDPAEIATQYHESRMLPGAADGAVHAVSAANAAERAAAHDRAARLWRIASELAPTSSERVEIAWRLALAEATCLRFSESVAAADEALAAGAPADAIHPVLRALKNGGAPFAMWQPLLSRCLARTGRDDLARARLAVLVDLLEPVATGPWYVSELTPPDAGTVARLRASGFDSDLAATVSPFTPRSREETEALGARAFTMQAGSEKIAVLDAVVRDWIHRHADYRRAEAAAEALLSESRRIGHVAGEAEAHYELAKCRAILGDLAAAREHAGRVPSLVARLGPAHRLRFTVRTTLRFEISYFGGGEWAAIAEQAVRFARDPRAGATPLGALSMSLGALAAAMAGDRATAAEIVTILPSLVARMTQHVYQRKQAIDLAAAAVWHIELHERAPEYRELLAAAPPGEGTAPITCTDLGVARMAALMGDRREAQRRYRRAREWAEERGAAPLAAIARYEEGALGGAHRGMSKARAEVEAAHAAFVALGMQPWKERAGGAAPTLPDGLTAREAEVLACVAAGLANKEVALRLRISAATVQRHLANAYAKIRVTSRSQATSYVLRMGLSYMAGASRSA